MHDGELDTGIVAEVPEDQRLDVDEGPDSDAIEGGDDTDGLEDVYANPGQASRCARHTVGQYPRATFATIASRGDE